MVASMCLVAGGLVSIGWASNHTGESKSERKLGALSASAEEGKSKKWFLNTRSTAQNIEKQGPMPDELEVNGQKYKKVKNDYIDGFATKPLVP